LPRDALPARGAAGWPKGRRSDPRCCWWVRGELVPARARPAGPGAQGRSTSWNAHGTPRADRPRSALLARGAAGWAKGRRSDPRCCWWVRG